LKVIEADLFVWEHVYHGRQDLLLFLISFVLILKNINC
jgi:hypothetical protein